MLTSQQIKGFLTNLFAFALLTGTFFAVHTMSMDETVSAEGQLGKYYGIGNHSFYFGDIYPTDLYPGDRPPLYPGDQKWDGLYYWNYNAPVTGLSTDGNVIYAGTSQPPYAGDWPMVVGQWQENRWKRVAPGAEGYLQGTVHTTLFHQNRLYIGGYIGRAGSKDVSNIAFWDGLQWNNMGGGFPNKYSGVQALAGVGNNIYAGGDFQTVGNISASNIARWDGTQWHALGAGVNGKVLAIAAAGQDIYVGGIFTRAGDQDITGIARWDGAQWHPLGSGVDGRVNSIDVDGTDVYIGGRFVQAGGKQANSIARWDGTQWHTFGTGLTDQWGRASGIEAIEVTPSGVYVGGNFRLQVGNYTANRTALWDGKNWNLLGSGPTDGGHILDILALNNRIYFSGDFTLAGNNYSNSFAAWNPQPTLIAYRIGDMAISPGSTILLYGRFFPVDQPVQMLIRSKTNPQMATLNSLSSVESNNNGNVLVRLNISESTPPGDYEITLVVPGASASYNLSLRLDAPKALTPYIAPEVSILDLTNLTHQISLPVIRR